MVYSRAGHHTKNSWVTQTRLNDKEREREKKREKRDRTLIWLSREVVVDLEKLG